MKKENDHIIQLLNKNSKKEVSMFLELLQSNFNKSTEYYIWKHNLNEQYEVEEYTFCIYDNDLCVATIQMIVNTLLASEKEIRFALLCDGATHKAYRRYGLFERMLNKCVEYSKTIEVSFVYSTGNEKSRKALMKLGYKDFFAIYKAQKKIRYGHNFLKPLNIINHTIHKIQSLGINKNSNSVNEIDIEQYYSFISSNKKKFNVYFDKSFTHLRWRIAKPDDYYVLFGSFDKDELSAILALQFNEGKMYMIDYMCSDNCTYHMSLLTKHVINLAWKKRDVKHINLIRNNFDQIENVLIENGFDISKQNIKTLIKQIEEKMLFTQNELSNMHYMRIDKNE